MNPKIAGKWMFIPFELIIIAFDPPPHMTINYPIIRVPSSNSSKPYPPEKNEVAISRSQNLKRSKCWWVSMVHGRPKLNTRRIAIASQRRTNAVVWPAEKDIHLEPRKKGIDSVGTCLVPLLHKAITCYNHHKKGYNLSNSSSIATYNIL